MSFNFPRKTKAEMGLYLIYIGRWQTNLCDCVVNVKLMTNDIIPCRPKIGKMWKKIIGISTQWIVPTSFFSSKWKIYKNSFLMIFVFVFFFVGFLPEQWASRCTSLHILSGEASRKINDYVIIFHSWFLPIIIIILRLLEKK